MKKAVKKLKSIYVLSFMIPVCGILGIFIARGIFPFGKNSFMFSDMYHQYIPFLKEFCRKIHAGEGLSFSWYVGLGSDFVPVYAYYLASPVNWLACLCPEQYLIEFMTYFIVIKIGLCGVTFAYYLRRHFDTKDLRIVWFSVFYAMSGFMAAYNWNHMWLDVVWLAPLVILGLEELVQKGKYRLYCLTLCAAVFSNYYLSILLCIFLVLYFFLQLFTNGLSLREKGRAVLQFGFFSLLSGMSAAVLLFPVMDAMRISDFQGGSFPKKVEIYFNVLEVLARHVPMLQTERGLDHWPNIYCGVLVFILIPVYFWHKRIPVKQKLGHALLLTVILAAFSVNILNYIWHGFNYPNSLPARQSFLYIFVVLKMCFEAVHLNGENRPVNRLAGGITGCLFLTACGIFVKTEGLTTTVMAGAWIFLAGYLLLALLFSRSFRKRLKKQQKLGKLALMGKWMILLLVSVEAIMNMEHTSLKPVQRTYYQNRVEDYTVLATGIEAEDTEIYRMENLAQMTKNDGILGEYMSASVFSSGLNGAIEDYYDKLGMGGSKVSYYYQGATPLTSAMLGVKYTFSQEILRDENLYRFVGQHGTTYLYENCYTLPVGFVLSADAKEEIEDRINSSAGNGIVIQNSITRAICGGKSLFCIESSAKTEGNTITVPVENDGHFYGLVVEKPEGTVLLQWGEEEKELKKVSKDILLDLGWFADGETFTLTAEEEESINIRIYRLQEEVLADTITFLGREPFLAEEITENGMTGTVNAKKDGILVLSVPAEPGWQVLMDGEETETEKFADTMLAIPVTAGKHTVTLTYYIYGVREGAAVSGVCVLLYLLTEWTVYRRRQKQKQKQQTQAFP